MSGRRVLARGDLLDAVPFPEPVCTAERLQLAGRLIPAPDRTTMRLMMRRTHRAT